MWRRLLACVVVLAACGSGTARDQTTQPSGFPTAQLAVTGADGVVTEFCVWLADTPRARQQGLMGVTDLGRCPAMAFVFEAPTSGQFWMRSTLIALGISFWDSDGGFVSSATMVPCPDSIASADCPRTGATGDYLVAIEVPAGDELSLGLVEDSTIELRTG